VASIRKGGNENRPRPAVPGRGRQDLCRYDVLEDVRRQRVHMCTRFVTPSTTIALRWTLGLKARLVRRFEKLTFRPKTVVLAHTSHLPDTATSSR
jgi:hypothetical protein